MVKDKFDELYEALKKDASLAGISIKSFKRPDSLPNNPDCQNQDEHR